MIDDLFDYAAARDAAMAQVERNAGEEFAEAAYTFVLRFLGDGGEHSSEEIVNACKAAGICPHDDRAFGPVIMRLSRGRLIEKCGSCERKKGHGTAGGNIWRIAP